VGLPLRAYQRDIDQSLMRVGGLPLNDGVR
jgi:hypothetical protein